MNYKFENCSFRDSEEDCIVESGCCGKSEVKKDCFLCLHPELLITNLSPDVCEHCVYFKDKKQLIEKE